uniref:Uncharacterized protein n=1 Tax=Rhizophora mucronata TaxID=61149 RepID=A0A2P2NWW6_RHIMU
METNNKELKSLKNLILIPTLPVVS